MTAGTRRPSRRRSSPGATRSCGRPRPTPTGLATGLNLIYLSSQPGGLEQELQRRLLQPSPALTDYLLLADDLDAVGERVQAYADAGVQWIILTQRAPFDHDALAHFAEKVIPAFR